MGARAQRRVTSRDVAARAGVSQATVSLVLTGNPRARVADETRERVLEAARELDYRPNLLARGLVKRRSYTIGVVVPDIANPFFAEVAAGAQRVAAEAGYAVVLCDAREVPVERHLEALEAQRVAGVLLDAAGAGSLGSRALAGLDVVLVDEPAGRRPGVASDALGAGRLAAEHLLGLGHRRIGFIGPAIDTHAFRMRERGFFQALRAAGIEPESALLRRAPATAAGGQAAMRALLGLAPRPTAVFCVNDLAAVGALKAAHAAKVSVPRELSLMGCDDIELSRLVTPELTTVAVPARELGARAARLLLRRLAGSEAEAKPPRVLPVRLVVRGTTAAPAAEAA